MYNITKKRIYRKRSFIREILEAIDSKTISFAGGLPDENLFPSKKLRACANRVLKDKNTYQYALSSGILKLKEIIADMYNDDVFDTRSENILITAGSQQALYIIAKYFQNQNIIIEKPSYLGAVNVFSANNLSMFATPLNHDGICIKKFKKAYKNEKLAYLIPDFQNPKGSQYSDKKRRKIVDIVNKHGGYIIEDAPYSELYFDKKAKSISSKLPNNSFHLGSFSKTLSPAFRVGWIRAESALIDKLVSIKESMDLHTSSISQHILANYLEDKNEYKRHLQTIRDNYKNKMEYFAKTLKKELPNMELKKPKGGMFIYAKLKGFDSKKTVKFAMKKGVVYVPGCEFYLHDKICNEFRFNYTHSTKKEIKEGILRLKQII